MSYTDLGVIKHLKFKNEKGYFRLIIGVNLPYHTKYLQFNVWQKELLMNGDGQFFGINDEVQVEYVQKDGFLQLSKLTGISLEYCPVCFTGLERIETQRMNCSGCSLLPCDGQKERINTEMMLTESVPKHYKYSLGYRLKLTLSGWDSKFTCVIFSNNPMLYSIVPTLEVGKIYTVIGWRNGNLLDLCEIIECGS